MGSGFAGTPCPGPPGPWWLDSWTRRLAREAGPGPRTSGPRALGPGQGLPGRQGPAGPRAPRPRAYGPRATPMQGPFKGLLWAKIFRAKGPRAKGLGQGPPNSGLLRQGPRRAPQRAFRASQGFPIPTTPHFHSQGPPEPRARAKGLPGQRPGPRAPQPRAPGQGVFGLWAKSFPACPAPGGAKSPLKASKASKGPLKEGGPQDLSVPTMKNAIF